MIYKEHLVRDIVMLRASGMTVRRIADRYQVTTGRIYRLLSKAARIQRPLMAQAKNLGLR